MVQLSAALSHICTAVPWVLIQKTAQEFEVACSELRERACVVDRLQLSVLVQAPDPKLTP